MPQIEGWATLHSPSAGAGALVLTAPVIDALEQPLTRAKYYAESEDEAGTLLWEFGVCSIRGTVIVRRDVINSSAGVGTTVEFPATGVRLSISDPVVATAQPGGGGGLSNGDYGAFTVTGGGTTATLNDDVVTADNIPDGALPASKLADGVIVTTTELQDSLGVPNTLGKRCELLLQFRGIANGTFVLDPKATFPYTIAKLNHEGSEALTANVKIGATSVTGLSAVAVTTSNADTNATAANVVEVGDRVTVEFTEIATTADVTLKLVVDRD